VGILEPVMNPRPVTKKGKQMKTRRSVTLLEERKQLSGDEASQWISKHGGKPDRRKSQRGANADRLRRTIRQAGDFDLRGAIERDIREIADDRFFNTAEDVQREVDRRIAGIKQTQAIIGTLKKGDNAC